MTPDSQKKRRILVFAGIIVLLAGMLMLSGCTTQPAATPVTTPAVSPATTVPPTNTTPETVNEMKVYNETSNGSTVKIALGKEQIMVSLAENPTTGFSWNASVTSGLAIVNDSYQPSPQSQTMVGAGGVHSWVLTGTSAGEQKFSAVYMRPWENMTGSEDTFLLNILVEKV